MDMGASIRQAAVMSVGQVPYLLGHTEIAELYGVARQTPQLWRTRGVLGGPDLEVSGKPYWLLPTVLALAEFGQREVRDRALEEYKARYPQGYAAPSTVGIPVIVGLAEIALIFEKTYAVVSQWRNRSSITDPDLTVSGAPLWLLESVLADADSRGRGASEDKVALVRAGSSAVDAQPRKRIGAPVGAAEVILPQARMFASAESSAAVVFVEEILQAGDSIWVEPRRASRPAQPCEDEASPVSGGERHS